MVFRTARPLLAVLAVLAVLPVTSSAQPSDPTGVTAQAWTTIGGALPSRHDGNPVETRPERFRAFELDRSTLAAALAAAPLENTTEARRAPAVIDIAGPDGVERFEVVESPVMEPGLARRHPDIRTYAGRGIDDPTATVRLDLTPLGFHAIVRSRRGAWYVDPYYRNDQSTYVAYFGRDLPDVHGPVELRPPVVTDSRLSDPGRRAARAPGDPVIQRVYRLALVSDPEYAAYFGGPANVTAAKVVLMNRVNQLYNDDLAIRINLIAGNDVLNLDTEAEYSGPAGPCVSPCYPSTNSGAPTDTGESCDLQTITQNNNAINAAVGPTSYDIGHIVLGKPGGGVAFLGVVGDPAQKAGGCTGVPTPKGDLFAVDYVSHEMGHQFAGNHTFNGNQHNCSGGNRNAGTSVEPGSGSTVMAYAGICRQDNLQPHSDPYFSQRSVDEIQAYVTSPDEEPTSTHMGSSTVATTNRSPVVTAPAAKTIPVRTPFVLTGTATDADGDTPVFLWEQNNQATGNGVALVSNSKPNGPLFRVFGRYADVSQTNTLLSPSPGENIATPADATRSFPDPSQVAADNTNAATGACPAVALAPASPAPAPPPVAVPVVECYSEFLPTSARSLTFRLTARDLFVSGGGLSSAQTVVTVAGTAPFRVTSQATPSSATGNSSLPVTWDAAGTSAAPFSTPNVRISYSTDGGLTFPTVLAASTPNDGAHEVVVPNVGTTSGRLRIQGVDNYFYDVTRGDLTVNAVTGTEPTVEPTTVPPTEPTTEPPAEPTTAPPTEPTATPPAVTPTPGPTPLTSGPAVVPGSLRLDLARVSRRLRVTNARQVRLRLRCASAGDVPAASRCNGTIRLLAKSGTRQLVVARRGYSIARGATRTITLTITRSVLRRLRARSLVVTVRATPSGSRPRSSSKRVRILRLRR